MTPRATPLLIGLLLAGILVFPGCVAPGRSGAGRDDSARLSAALADAAREAAKDGKMQESLALNERLYKSDPHAPKYILAYARNLRYVGRVDDARLVIQSPAREPGAPEPVLTECAMVMVSAGEYALGQEYARRAVDKDPASPDAHQALALSLSGLGLHSQAQAEFEKALSLWPKERDRTSVINNLAMARAAQGDIKGARDTMSLATGQALESKTYMNNRMMLDTLGPGPVDKRINAPATRAPEVRAMLPAPAAAPAPVAKVEIRPLPDAQPFAARKPARKPVPASLKMQPVIE